MKVKQETTMQMKKYKLGEICENLLTGNMGLLLILLMVNIFY